MVTIMEGTTLEVEVTSQRCPRSAGHAVCRPTDGRSKRVQEAALVVCPLVADPVPRLFCRTGRPRLLVSSWACPVGKDWRVGAGVSSGWVPGRLPPLRLVVPAWITRSLPLCCCQPRSPWAGPPRVQLHCGDLDPPMPCSLGPPSPRVCGSRKLLPRRPLLPFICSSKPKKHIHLCHQPPVLSSRDVLTVVSVSRLHCDLCEGQ